MKEKTKTKKSKEIRFYLYCIRDESCIFPPFNFSRLDFSFKYFTQLIYPFKSISSIHFLTERTRIMDKKKKKEER